MPFEKCLDYFENGLHPLYYELCHLLSYKVQEHAKAS